MLWLMRALAANLRMRQYGKILNYQSTCNPLYAGA
jgi:hypothetical protein